MHGTDQIAAARLRRTAAEAEEMALRAGLMRRGGGGRVVRDGPGFPVLEMDHICAPCGGRHDLLRIDGVPEVDGFDDVDRVPTAWALVFVWAGVAALILLGFALGWMVGTLDAQAVLDFLSPTAAKARDLGWVALSEGR